MYVPQRPTGLRRLLHLASFALSSAPVVLWRALTWRPDWVLVIAPTFFCVPGGWLAAKLAGGKAWLHVQDFELDAAFQCGLLKGRRLRAMAEQLERLLIRRMDQYSTISEQMQEKLYRKGARKERCILLPNWVNTRRIYPLNRPSRFRTELGLTESDIVVLYAGSMGQKQGLELVLEVARRCEHVPRMHFILCGDGAAKAQLVERAQGMRNVRFLPMQPAERLNELLNLGDVHLLVQRPEVADSVMPSKLSGILAAGGAVIATAHSRTELSNVLHEAKGQVVEPGNAAALEHRLRVLNEFPEQRLEMSRSGRHFAETHFSQEAILRQFAAALQDGARDDGGEPSGGSSPALG
jgi:colanic acid biosynthesis glycosyl transferase WcaI